MTCSKPRSTSPSYKVRCLLSGASARCLPAEIPLPGFFSTPLYGVSEKEHELEEQFLAVVKAVVEAIRSKYATQEQSAALASCMLCHAWLVLTAMNERLLVDPIGASLRLRSGWCTLTRNSLPQRTLCASRRRFGSSFTARWPKASFGGASFADCSVRVLPCFQRRMFTAHLRRRNADGIRQQDGHRRRLPSKIGRAHV